MNYAIDIVLLLCLGWGAYKGFRKGFIIQSFVILALTLAIWGGFAFAGRLEPFLQNHLKMSEVACSVISFIVVFVLILILVYTSGYLVTKVANAATLGMLNRISGAAFGILANALVLSVLILLFDRVNDEKHFVEPEILGQTYLYKPIGKVAPAIFPESFFKIIKDGKNKRPTTQRIAAHH
jgi:membrane protein required for colicin V production